MFSFFLNKWVYFRMLLKMETWWNIYSMLKKLLPPVHCRADQTKTGTLRLWHDRIIFLGTVTYLYHVRCKEYTETIAKREYLKVLSGHRGSYCIFDLKARGQKSSVSTDNHFEGIYLPSKRKLTAQCTVCVFSPRNGIFYQFIYDTVRTVCTHISRLSQNRWFEVQT
jgi:hypothetical protein